MIGILSKYEEREVVQEFFQLFKTPWEFYDPERSRYDVLISTDQDASVGNAALLIIYGSEKTSLDEGRGLRPITDSSSLYISWEDDLQVPIYGRAATFADAKRPFLLRIGSRDVVGYEVNEKSQRVLRIGYNLFDEISFLLTNGQPIENALIPTLDLHIDMLRKWILESDIALIEIPPVPSGYGLIACLTHDVDFIGIRRQFLDHSMGGFLYRATLGSLLDFLRNRMPLSSLLENFQSVCSLPFVFLGLCPDPWDQFDHYLELEEGAPSTFFFIPRKNHAGETCNGKLNPYRAAKYDVDDARDAIGKIVSHGGEVGVHGIDAWHDKDNAKSELARLREVTRNDSPGVRMHWLCWKKSTFAILDQAGYAFDSSFGYNETVGFKAGTAQAYRPLGVKDLLELPLHIQDTALFSPERMHSTTDQATFICDQILENVAQYKGALTLLWHQRSLGPERLWGDFYQFLINRLKAESTWFATAGDVVAWFRQRRSVRFTKMGELDYTHSSKGERELPRLLLRRHISSKNAHDQAL